MYSGIEEGKLGKEEVVSGGVYGNGIKAVIAITASIPL